MYNPESIPQESISRIPRRRRHKENRISKWLLVPILALFVCGGAVSAYYFFDMVREYIATGNLPVYNIALGQIVPSDTKPVSTMPNLAAGERVNILLLGIDKREGEKGPYRTDTMIVGTLDPKTKSAGMLSIPRDLYVPIPYPNVGENRINTANFYGDMNKYPGGGPALAKKTVEYNFGIPVHFYVLIDFSGFKKIVDTLGGIDVDVPTPIYDPEYPTEDYGTEVLQIPAGHLHMDGVLALKYARTRHTTNDFDRSKRQRQILVALRDKAVKLDMLPKLPQLYAQFKDTVQTDLTLPQIIALASVAKDIRADNIQSRAIDQTMAKEIVLNNGADVLWPDRAKIAVVINEMFLPQANASDRAPQGETAHIAILNGTPHVGYAQRCADFLKPLGFTVTQISNADRSDYKQTQIFDNGKNPATLAALATALSVSSDNVHKLPATTTNIDTQIILGADWVPPLQP